MVDDHAARPASPQSATFAAGHALEPRMSGMRVLFSAAEIAARVDALAADIARTVPPDFLMVGLLKGAAVFVADLARALDRVGARPEIEFMRLASYGLGKQSNGAVQLLGDVPTGLAGRPVLLVDDIVDTGRSIAYAATQLRRRGVGGLWICALLNKPQRREVEVAIDFIGFSIANVFVVGYGTDHAEKYRHLPYIGIVE
jgi:hypoxanthine phosphoribosyltransferase